MTFLLFTYHVFKVLISKLWFDEQNDKKKRDKKIKNNIDLDLPVKRRVRDGFNCVYDGDLIVIVVCDFLYGHLIRRTVCRV